ncbi:MAG TPA: SIMPL domain-containing protein [Anaerolineales bacterium]|nr:SIMPL domain-containing protein [Anaerolineales bacterium]
MNKIKFASVLSAAALLALALSACGAPASGLAADNTTQPPHTISVTGNGIAYGTPDIAVAQIGVEVRDADPAAAVDKANEKMASIMSAIKGLGVEDKDLQTTNFSVYAQQDFEPETGRPTGTYTYVVNNTLNVTVRDLKMVGDVLGKAVGAGANSINGVTFSVSDTAALEAEARDKAMADAKARAEQLAKAAGVTLDQPMSINEYTAGPIPYVAEVKAAPALGVGGGEPVPVSTGQIQVNLQVSVTYIIQ